MDVDMEPQPRQRWKHSDYTAITKLGEGTYGYVSKARNIHTGEIVAIKMVKVEHEDQGIPATTIREVAILKRLADHENVVKLFDCLIDGAKALKIYLIFEFVEMDLKMYMEQQTLEASEIQDMTRSILKGINHCLENGIMHRDLKPQNILVEQGKIKVADFGLAREVNFEIEPLTHEVVTLWYRCPEILMGTESYGFGVDSWSIGCIMAEMYQGSPIFQGDSEIDQLFKIFQVLGTPSEELWPGVTKLKCYNRMFPKWRPFELKQVLCTMGPAVDLIEKLIILDPQKRLNPREALLHNYFQMSSNELESYTSG